MCKQGLDAWGLVGWGDPAGEERREVTPGHTHSDALWYIKHNHNT